MQFQTTWYSASYREYGHENIDFFLKKKRNMNALVFSFQNVIYRQKIRIGRTRNNF